MRDKEGRLTLVDEGVTLTGDLTRMRKRLAPHALNRELIVRAARLRTVSGTPHAVDATAGLCEDSLLLAACGFEVTMFERDHLTYELAADALRRALGESDLAPLVRRMRLIEGDAVELMPTLDMSVDLVYLDPMFPSRHKAAATKKKLQVLRQLESPATDEEATRLVQAALSLNPRRIVVKRPLKGPYLAGVKPSHSLSGKLIRYDCLIG